MKFPDSNRKQTLLCSCQNSFDFADPEAERTAFLNPKLCHSASEIAQISATKKQITPEG